MPGYWKRVSTGWSSFWGTRVDFLTVAVLMRDPLASQGKFLLYRATADSADKEDSAHCMDF
jgi:hypothetical protein